MGLSWKFIQSGLGINTHVKLKVRKHTQRPQTCRGNRSLPCKTPQHHTCGLLTCSVDSSIFHWWERRHRTRGGERWVRDNTTREEKKHTCLFFPHINTDECRCQQSCKRRKQGGSMMAGGGKTKTGWKAVQKTKQHLGNSLLSTMHCLVCGSPLKPVKSTFLHRTPRFSITISIWIMKKKRKRKLNWILGEFPPLFKKLRKGCLFITFQYVFRMFSLLAVLGQVIPKGTESPFLAVRLRRCWAWNPITRAAMPALWHQTLPMQNATAGVYHQLSPQPSRCRGIHWWVTWLTRGGRDDTSDADVGQNVRQ